MRYSEILTEKIVSAPRNLKLFITNRIRELAAAIADMEAGSKTIDANDGKGGGMLTYWLRYGSDYAPEADDLHLITNLTFRSDIRTLENLRHSLTAYVEHGPDFLRYVESNLTDAKGVALDEPKRAVAAILPHAKAGAVQYGFEDGDPENEKDEEYVAAVQLLAGIKQLLSGIQKAEAVVARLSEKLGVLLAKRVAYFSGKSFRPEHEEVETLYHTTAFAPEILRSGFAAEKPLDRVGLGNYGFQKTISFTHDLAIAHDIARTFKEVWMIAHGQLTAREIVGWIKAEKIDQEYPNLETTIGIGVKVPHEDSRFGPRDRLKKLHELTGPKDALRLLIVYLSLSKIRANPVMVSGDELLDVMKTRRLDDIGILACQVRLGDDAEYMEGEAEFRVAPDRVLSVKRVI